MLLDRHVEHLAGRSAVDVAAGLKDLHTPGFAGQEGQHTCFDSGEVADDEFVPLLRDKSSADQLAECIWNILV